MEIIMCTTCGTQYNSCSIPEKCLICNDERQYINPDGQSWTTLKRMVQQGDYKNSITFEESGLYSIKTIPKFAIGQTAYIIHQNNFRLLWDCISYLDKATIQEIKEMGGLNAIALSHPHYYSSQVEWAETFDIPIYIHMDDRSWVMRPSDQIIFWSGESIEVYPGLTLYRLGGHFKGASVLEWKDGNEGKGVLLTGDVIQVVADNQWVSFMYSYPNLIPLPAAKVEKIAAITSQLSFDRLYNAFHGIIKEQGKLRVQQSAARYISALNGSLFDT